MTLPEALLIGAEYAEALNEIEQSGLAINFRDVIWKERERTKEGLRKLRD